LVIVMPVDEYSFYTPDGEVELGDILEGRRVGHATPWPGHAGFSSQGVICRDNQDGDEPLRPFAIVLQPEEFRRFFGRYSQLRGDLSPVSAWCHVVTPRDLERLQSADRIAELNGFEAAWTGLIVAEALMLAERPISQVKIAACFSTHSYAIARTIALWPNLHVEEIVGRYEHAQSLLVRGASARHARLRQNLASVWDILLEAAQPFSISHRRKFSVLAESIRALELSRRRSDPNEGYRFVEPMEHLVPSANVFRNLEKLSPEQRLQLFDKLLLLAEKESENSIEQNAVLMLAGYLATVAAGGSASLSLVEASSKRWPQITAWAYVLGSIGERVVWTSSFDGLGRLVARELLRPFRLSDAPTCDFSLDEAEVLVDPQLSDPFVHLRIKQSRVLTVAVLPGVNISLPIASDASHEVASTSAGYEEATPFVRNEEFARLANSLWPYLRELMQGSNFGNGQYGNDVRISKSRNQRRSGAQSKLPLK
jgi:hypothetical protein